jgi:hypothetical protein
MKKQKRYIVETQHASLRLPFLQCCEENNLSIVEHDRIILL